MLSIAHSSVGALIATRLPNPIVSVPLILCSHYILDYVIHWDCGTGLSSGRKTIKTALQHEFVDLIATAVFIYMIFEPGSAGINYQAWFGAFVGLVPDFMEAPRNFFKWEPAFLKPFNRFHHSFHHSTPNMIVGLTPQLVLLFFIALAA